FCRFDPVHLSFGLPLTPWRGKGGGDGGPIPLETRGKLLQLGDTTVLNGSHPGIQASQVVVPKERAKAPCQRLYLGDFRTDLLQRLEVGTFLVVQLLSCPQEQPRCLPR